MKDRVIEWASGHQTLYIGKFDLVNSIAEASLFTAKEAKQYYGNCLSNRRLRILSPKETQIRLIFDS